MQMSQAQLGESMGITFQQVQKYESGANRISAARLFRLSQVVRVSITYFFEEAAGKIPSNRSKGTTSDFFGNSLSKNENIQLTVAFAQISNLSVRQRALDLIKSLAKEARS
jgi:transcriptional regulator with XRE-family HTH domain